MFRYLLLLAAAVVCVSARYTVPVPIHYEIEAQFQKQSNVRTMRWDPTNYLTYLAAVYAQCNHLYGPDGSRLIQNGRVPNATAYTTLQQFFDPSLLQSNLIVAFWDVPSQEAQDAGTVDRDIRKLSGKANGLGPVGNLPNFDSVIRNYDRFGCSVETTCKQGTTPMMALVCIFGQSNPQKQVSGTGGSGQGVQPARPTAAVRPPVTTRPRARPTAAATTTTTTTTTTTAAPASTILGGGLYQTYQDHSQEFYDTIIKDTPASPIISADIVPDEQKLVELGLCTYENNPEGFTAELLMGSFDADVTPILYGVALSPRPAAEDLTASPISDVAKSAIRTVLENKLTSGVPSHSSIACAWAQCSEKFLLGCAAWGAQYDESQPIRRVKS